MVNFSTMIKRFYPDAIPDIDFRTETAEDGTVSITDWNAKKLGPEPNLSLLHANYMKLAREIKERSPKFDDSDPAPWLNAKEKKEPEQVRYQQTIHQHHNRFHIPVVNFDPETGIVTERGNSEE